MHKRKERVRRRERGILAETEVIDMDDTRQQDTGDHCQQRGIARLKRMRHAQGNP